MTTVAGLQRTLATVGEGTASPRLPERLKVTPPSPVPVGGLALGPGGPESRVPTEDPSAIRRPNMLLRLRASHAPASAASAASVIRRKVEWKEVDNKGVDLADPTIESIRVDRPTGTGKGAHTTAYQLFIETVQNALIGATYSVGVDRLEALAKDAYALPGWTDTKKQKKLADAFDASMAQAAPLKGKKSMNAGVWIEELAWDYLRIRNACDFNYHQDGEGGVGGFHEMSHLKAASGAHQTTDFTTIEADIAAGTPTVTQAENIKNFSRFIKESAALLDTRDVKRPKGNAASRDVSAWVDRWQNIIHQHVASIIAAHPGADAAEDLIVDRLVDRITATVTMNKSEIKQVKGVLKTNKSGWTHIAAAP